MTSGGIVREVSNCRVCGSENLVKYLDLGMMPLANNLAASAVEARTMQRYAMQVLYCRGAPPDPEPPNPQAQLLFA